MQRAAKLDAAYYRQGKDPAYKIPSVDTIVAETQVKLKSKDANNKNPSVESSVTGKDSSKSASQESVENKFLQEVVQKSTRIKKQ